MKKSLIVGLLASVMFVSFASLVFAALPTEIQTLPGSTVTTPTALFNVIKNVGNIIFTVLIIVAVIFILLAAFQFITGGGNAEALEQARAKLIWGAVGIGVAFVAQALPTLLQGFLAP
jgi:magnesium-transporting ATPase (P-type)